MFSIISFLFPVFYVAYLHVSPRRDSKITVSGENGFECRYVRWWLRAEVSRSREQAKASNEGQAEKDKQREVRREVSKQRGRQAEGRAEGQAEGQVERQAEGQAEGQAKSGKQRGVY
jgi:phage protein D